VSGVAGLRFGSVAAFLPACALAVIAARSR
jgi:hypothetical protein